MKRSIAEDEGRFLVLADPGGGVEVEVDEALVRRWEAAEAEFAAVQELLAAAMEVGRRAELKAWAARGIARDSSAYRALECLIALPDECSGSQLKAVIMQRFKITIYCGFYGMMRELVEVGFVARRDDPAGRESLYRVTDAGLAVHAAASGRDDPSQRPAAPA